MGDKSYVDDDSYSNNSVTLFLSMLVQAKLCPTVLFRLYYGYGHIWNETWIVLKEVHHAGFEADLL